MTAEVLPVNKPMSDPRMAEYLPVSVLRIDSQTQRAVDETRVNRMAQEWDWNKAEAITVVANGDGTYFVVEGQNRVEALRILDPNALVLCAVIPISNNEEKAATALGIAKGRRAMSAVDQYALRINAGDPTAVEIAWLLHDKNLRIAKHDAPRTTKAAAAMFQIVESGRGRTTIEDGVALLGRVLDVVLAAWPTDPHAGRDDRFPSLILVAVAEILALGYSDRDVVKSLKAKRRGPEYWLGLTGGRSRREAMVSNLIAALPQLQP